MSSGFNEERPSDTDGPAGLQASSCPCPCPCPCPFTLPSIALALALRDLEVLPLRFSEVEVLLLIGEGSLPKLAPLALDDLRLGIGTSEDLLDEGSGRAEVEPLKRRFGLSPNVTWTWTDLPSQNVAVKPLP